MSKSGGKRLKLLFLLVDLEVKFPHKFRHGHAVYGLLHAQTMADYKAVSMNLMHDSIEITDRTYAPMLSSDVQKRISGLTNNDLSDSPFESSSRNPEFENMLNQLDKENLGRALFYIAGKLTQ